MTKADPDHGLRRLCPGRGGATARLAASTPDPAASPRPFHTQLPALVSCRALCLQPAAPWLSQPAQPSAGRAGRGLAPRPTRGCRRGQAQALGEHSTKGARPRRGKVQNRTGEGFSKGRPDRAAEQKVKGVRVAEDTARPGRAPGMRDPKGALPRASAAGRREQGLEASGKASLRPCWELGLDSEGNGPSMEVA